ncbi:hypothetical protein AYO44_06395 [Planctomycetaceae bacterium SCGC AG-212-F19]|nr:hypothetical protein AYO44_06395 [Planctomycetaceae bacterium SCGC AG-212-F19]
MPPTLYRFFDLVVQSDVALPELQVVHGHPPDWTLRLAAEPRLQLDGWNWFHHSQLADQRVWLSFGKNNSGYIIRFPDMACFTLSSCGKTLGCHPERNLPLATLRHLLLDQVIPLAASLQGLTVLHASAVLTPLGAVAFLGDTGQGKSTIAAGFCRAGDQLLTDDCLLLREQSAGILGLGSYCGSRLWPDVASALVDDQSVLVPIADYTAKKRLLIGGAAARVGPHGGLLRGVYVLAGEEGEAITMAQLSWRESFMELSKQAFRLDWTDREMLRNEFQNLTRLAKKLRLSRLAYPRKLSVLSAVREDVIWDLEQAVQR